MKIKRTICLILATLMVLACLPAIAFAGNGEAVIKSVGYNGKSYIPSGKEITLDVPASSAALNLQKELELVYDESKGYKYYAPLFPDGATLEYGKTATIRVQYEQNGTLYESDYTVKLNKLPFSASAFTGNITRRIVLSDGDDRPGKKIFQDCYIKNDGPAFGGIVINGVDPNIAVFKLAGKELDSAAAVKVAAEELDNLYISPRNPGKMSVLLKAYAADGKDISGHASLDIQVIKTGTLETLRANLDQYGVLAASYFGLDAAFIKAVGEKPASIKIVSGAKYGHFICDYKSDVDHGKTLANGVAISAEEFAALSYVPIRAAIVSDVTDVIGYEAFDAAGNKYVGSLEIGINYKKPDGSELSLQVELNTAHGLDKLDFTSAFKTLSNDELSYVKFTKPDAAFGSIRENYRDETLPGVEIDEATKYYNSSSFTKKISNLSFVPAKGYEGSFYLLYTAYSVGSDTGYSGRIRVTVRNIKIPAIDCEVMQDEFLRFDGIYELINEQFKKVAKSDEGYSYIKFELPTSTQGELYYNYNAQLQKGEPLASSDRYYRTASDLKLVKDVYFVPNRNNSGNFELKYNCYATGGEEYKGTVNVSAKKLSYDIKTLTYTLKQGEIFKVKLADLSAELAKLSSDEVFSYIYLNKLPAKTTGTLYASYSDGEPGAELVAGEEDKYYREGSGLRLVSDISFVPEKDFSGIVRLEYTAYISAKVKYSGKIVLDIKDSGGVLSEIKWSADSDGIIKFKSEDFVAALGKLTNQKLSEIRLDLPAENYGTFYCGYRSADSFDSKLELKTPLYLSGEKRKLIDDVSLVAAVDYEGSFSVNYTAVDELSREYSGKLIFEISYKSSFVDVKKTDYFASAVKWAVEKKITAGISEDKFGPGIVCTRAQMVTLLWNAAGSPQPKSVNPFKDVKYDDYYFNAVRWAHSEGITSGTSADTFSPDKEVTRAQVMTMLYNYHDKPAVSIVNPFKDVAATQYYYKPVLWAYQAGVTKGTGPGRFSPSEGCTRAQIVTFLYNDMKE